MARSVIRNLDEVNRALLESGVNFRRERDVLFSQVGAKVARDAEGLARGRITNVGRDWSRMRHGVLTHSVYVAPVQRGTKVGSRKRRKFADLLMGRAMLPAATNNTPAVVRQFDRLLANMERRFRG